MGLDAIALAQVYQIVKNSDRMSKGLDAAEKSIINKGLELIEEAGDTESLTLKRAGGGVAYMLGQ